MAYSVFERFFSIIVFFFFCFMIRELHQLLFSMWVAKTKITSENRRNKSYFNTHKYKALSLVSLETKTNLPKNPHYEAQ